VDELRKIAAGRKGIFDAFPNGWLTQADLDEVLGFTTEKRAEKK
jgi:predicted DNA-binding ArsR family transcriptional regulator